MYKQHSNMERKNDAQIKNSQWIDSVDLELIFMNSIAICVVLLAIVIADVLL